MSKVSVGIVLCLCLVQGFGEARRKWSPAKDRPPYIDITEKNLTFQLFTRSNSKIGATLYIGDKKTLLASGFKSSLPTIVCTHGFMDNRFKPWVIRLRDEVLINEEANFIVLDWSDCSKNVLYEQTLICMKQAGRYTGQMLQFLQKETQLQMERVHLIGHSLGAQLLYFVSTVFPLKKTIGRITGLDPAAPLFEHAKETERLNPNAAKVVDVIHTCRILVGMKKPVGTVDFYVNGGFNQPGCADFDLVCHHGKSHEYFIDSIDKNRRNKYQGIKCAGLNDAINGTCYGKTATMGYYAEASPPGLYYLKVSTPVDN